MSKSDCAELVHDMRGFDRLDLPRNHQRITQTSRYAAQSWRANVDVQPLIYKTDEYGNVSPAEISRVTNYIVAYSCKGTESTVQEKLALESLILKQRDMTGSLQDVKRVARKILNEALKLRVISKQESLCQLVSLPLHLCSERIEHVSLAGEARLSTELQSKTSFLYQHANRCDCRHLSLADFFDHSRNVLNPETTTVIPHFTGANVEPAFPPTNKHMRGLLLAYLPWHKTFPYDSNANLSSHWSKFLKSPHCPMHIKLAHSSAYQAKIQREPLAKFDIEESELHRKTCSEDLNDLIDIATTMQIDAAIDTQENMFDFGLDFDWSFQ